MKLSDSSCDCAPGLFQVWYIRGLFIKQQGLIQSMEVPAYTSAGQPVEHVVGSGEVYMDFGTAMEISVVTASAVGSAGSNTQIMMRVVSLEGKLLETPEYQGVQEGVNHYSDPIVACASCVNSVGSSVPRGISWLASAKVLWTPPLSAGISWQSCLNWNFRWKKVVTHQALYCTSLKAVISDTMRFAIRWEFRN